jgi:tetratricopeptide (TPR) repeat protein
MSALQWKVLVVAFVLLGAGVWAVEWVPENQPAPPPATTQAPQAQPGEEAPPATPPPLAWVASVDEALAQAQSEKRPVLIEFHVTYQQWCRTLEEKTLSDPAIVKLSAKCICVRINGQEQQDLVKKYGVKSYPTVVYLNPKGEVIDRQIGFIPARPFEVAMKEIAAGKEPEKDFQKLVASNPTDFRSLVLLGIGYQKREEWDKAILSYEKALRAGPGMDAKEQQEVVYSLCPLYDFRGKPEKSEKMLLDLLNTDTAEKVKVHEMLGQTYLSLKRPNDAIRQFQAERELVQDDQQRQFIDQMIERIRKAQQGQTTTSRSTATQL